MKKSLILSLLLFGATPMIVQADCNTCASSCATSCNSCDDDCGCPCSGKTFFSVRPLFQSYRPELWSGFRNDRMIASQDGIGGAFEVVVLGSQSTKKDDVAKYFLPNCKNCLNVLEDATPGVAPFVTGANLLSQHFNIVTLDGTFSSTVSFQASQSVIGAGFHYKQGFWFNDDRTTWWYLDIATSVQRVKNNMELNETISNDGGGADTTKNPNAVGSIRAAFAQPAWQFGRIDSCPLVKTGLADVEFKFGREWIWSEHCHFGGYLGALIPTGNTPKGVNVFEAIVGNGHHWGISTGIEGGFELWSNRHDNWHLSLELASHSLYLFNKNQTRSFDLKGKPWSRYQEVYINQAQAAQANALFPLSPTAPFINTPGINVFTQRVKVKPGFSFNGTGALVLTNDCGFDIEVGYNFYARQAECVKLACPWPIGNNAPALKAAEGAGDTNPVRNITGNPTLEAINNPFGIVAYADSAIKQSDLDLESAAHPSYICYLVHAALGYRWDDICYPIHINGGASYEFSEREFAVLNRWVVWGKLGIAF